MTTGVLEGEVNVLTFVPRRDVNAVNSVLYSTAS